MGSGHRGGHRGRGRGGGGPHSSGERVLVLPGEEIPGEGLRPGPGTYRVNGRIYASVLGLLNHAPPVVRVVPLSGRYIPRPRDVVLGTVTDVQGTFWLLDIGAPRWAPLHMTGTPWKIDFGETAQYLHVGDAVVVAIEAIENTGRIGVTMLGDGLGKLEGGTIVEISPAKVPRVIGRGGSMIGTITRLTGARISVGQNGRVWIDGTPEAIARVRECLRMIEEEGQRPGLTERVEAYLQSHGDRPSAAERSDAPESERPWNPAEGPWRPVDDPHPSPHPPPGPMDPDDGDDDDDDDGPQPGPQM